MMFNVPTLLRKLGLISQTWAMVSLSNACVTRSTIVFKRRGNTQIILIYVYRSHVYCKLYSNLFYWDICRRTWCKIVQNFFLMKRKRRRSDPVLWQNPLYQQKIRKPKDNTQTPPKTLITQRLQTDLGRSVGVTSHPTGVVKPVYGYPTFLLTATAV